MIALGQDTVLLVFVLFCRIGGCLMFMPGFSSIRVPPPVRLFLAIATTLALTPLLLPQVQPAISNATATGNILLLVFETMTGAMIGLMARFFFLALDFMLTAAATNLGFGNLPGIPIESSDPVPALGALITVAATTLFFISDLHWDVLRGLVDSYEVLPVTGGYQAQFGLIQATDTLTKAFALALQISSPFIVYSIAINMLFGIANKLAPQIAVYFVSLPFVVMGGLLLLYFVSRDYLTLFISEFQSWLVTG